MSKTDAVFSLVAILVLIAACTGTTVRPKTSEQQAFYLYGTFVVAEEAGARLVSNPAVPEEIKSHIRALDSVAKPAADLMFEAALQVGAVREANADPALVDAAIAGLDAAFADALPKIRNLMFVIKEYRDGSENPGSNPP